MGWVSSVRLTNSQISVVLSLGRLGDGLVPVLAVEQHQHGVADLVLVLVEGDGAGGDGGGLGDARRSGGAFWGRRLKGCGEAVCAATRNWRMSKAPLRRCRFCPAELAEVDEEVGAFGGGEDEVLAARRGRRAGPGRCRSG